MLTQRLANIIFAVAVLLACGYFAMLAQDFEAAGLLASSGLPSKFFPQLILAFTAVCALAVIVSYLWHGQAGGDAGETVYRSSGEAWRGLLVLVVAIVCYVIWQKVGFVPMAVVMGPLCLAAMGVRNWRIYLTVLLLFGLVYLVFTRLLGTQFS